MYSFKNVSILVPYRSDHGHREQLFKWVMKFYEKLFPEVEVCIGYSNSPLFSKSEAINNAAKQATRDVFVMADADTIYDPSIIDRSIQLLNECGWVIPYNKVHYVEEQSTSAILNMEPTWPIPFDINCRVIEATEGYNFVGGINVFSRENFEYVGGYDERFEGWGGEDDAFNFAMNTLCGPYKRLDQPIYHLWHPPAPGNPDGDILHSNYEKNIQLCSRYERANGKRWRMKRLVNEHKREKDIN